MKTSKQNKLHWTMCLECQGLGKKKRRIRKQDRLRYQKALVVFNKSDGQGKPPTPLKHSLYPCEKCNGSGIIPSATQPIPDTDNYPHIAIIGGGIGGVALAVACLHRNIPFTLYERDHNFDARSQGYGLTLQQASKAMSGFGILELDAGIISTRHVVHTTDGTVIGEWGFRKWMQTDSQNKGKKTNVHIPRQSLRLALLDQLPSHNDVQWGHKLIDFKINEGEKTELNFQVDGQIIKTYADLVVGADGIRSTVRKLLIGEDHSPLRYLDCIVILGICPLKNLKGIESDLLDSATVFQTANGNERIYMMPFSSDSIMWQLSFPMAENDAKLLSSQGSKALKKEACKRTLWHNPIPQIMEATNESQISGYPVYDRALLTDEELSQERQITLLGDAAHPMSPFKGQGANQALLDALSLARGITKGCKWSSDWKENGIREQVLTEFEAEMLARSTSKVKDSAAAAKFLHSEIVLLKDDAPRGSTLKKNDK
ncbi:FAD-dependent oxidoreductase [Formosa undariae]|uniref:FAD-dependent oxidoreductase n=1 Tax=Formosa undariae TaxID=1325436 RepID=A0ABV5EYL9_9FLAO